MTDLHALLGPRLAALLTTPDLQLAATHIAEQIAAREGDGVARAWMIGQNPHLDDQYPLLAIADGRADEAQAAARAYLDGAGA